MAGSTIECRRLRAADLPALDDFTIATYGAAGAHKGRDRIGWQFENTPFRPKDDVADPTIWAAVTEDGDVVGEIAVQDGECRIDGAEYGAGWIVDVMVRPEYRGLGLSHRIHDEIMRERPCLITLTMAEATRRIAERANCITLGQTREYVCPHRLSTTTVRRYLKYKEGDRPDLVRWLRCFSNSLVGPAVVALGLRATVGLKRIFSSKPASVGFDFDEVDSFPDEVDDFWHDVKDAYPAIFDRSATFLNWRFRDCPELRYRRFLMHADGALRGYLVTRVGTEEELPVGVVADMFARPDDAPALDALLEHAHRVLGPRSEYLAAAASTESYRFALRRAAFIGMRTMRPTVVCSDEAARSAFQDNADAWHFTKADHDWDQIHPS